MVSLETFLSIALGFGLAAACGFRVFVPLLVAAIAARAGHLNLSPDFGWLAGDGALLALFAILAPAFVLLALVVMTWVLARIVRARRRTARVSGQRG